MRKLLIFLEIRLEGFLAAFGGLIVLVGLGRVIFWRTVLVLIGGRGILLSNEGFLRSTVLAVELGSKALVLIRGFIHGFLRNGWAFLRL